MRSFNTTLTAILTIAALGLATTAFAGGNGKKGGFSFSIGNSGHHHGHHHHHHHHGHYHRSYPVYIQSYGQAYEPFHCYYIVQPGDLLYTVSMKEYGTGAVANQIARFNRLPVNAQLFVGQRLMLPSVSANGVLSASRAPMPFVDGTTPTNYNNSTAKISQPKSIVNSNFANSNLAAKVTAAPTTPSLPSVAVGSTLVLDGQVFGETQGSARLRVGGLSLPIEVLEWTNSSAKIRLPEVELTGAVKAEIEVLRSDGSMASKSAVELTAANSRLALGN
jgi:hypothetical protein